MSHSVTRILLPLIFSKDGMSMISNSGSEVLRLQNRLCIIFDHCELGVPQFDTPNVFRGFCSRKILS